MDEIKALKEKLKKKNETIRKLRKDIEVEKDLHYQYASLYHRYLNNYEAIKNLLPTKYYKITFQIWKGKDILHRETRLISDNHYSVAISRLEEHYQEEGIFKLIDIEEVAS